MLLLLVTGLLMGSLLVLWVKKNRASLLLAGMCLSLTLFLLGIMLFIAKKSGISRELERFLFLSRDIRIWMQYRFLTLGQLGCLISLGRHLYPLCLLEMAMEYSMIPALWKSPPAPAGGGGAAGGLPGPILAGGLPPSGGFGGRGSGPALQLLLCVGGGVCLSGPLPAGL